MRRRLGILSVLGLTVWGCGPPEIAPMTPPGVAFPRATEEAAEALGETMSRGNVQATNVAPGADPAGARPDGATETALPPTPRPGAEAPRN